MNIKPELHDLLKLVGSSSKHKCPHHSEYGSYLSGLQGQYPDVWIPLKHHCVEETDRHKENGLNCTTYPISREYFCVRYADILASTISRILKGIYPDQLRTVFKVWKDRKPNKEDNKLSGDNLSTNIAMLEKIKLTKDFSSYIKDNEQLFKDRPEDIGRCPFASLYTHSILTKNWYDFLTRYNGYFEIQETIETIEKMRELANKIKDEKAVYLGYAKIKTDTLLVRLRDTFLFKSLKKVLKDCIEASGGTVLYELSEESLFVLPGCMESEDVMERMREKLSSNFYLELNFKNTNLPYEYSTEGEFCKSVSQLFGEPEKRLYPKLLNDIRPASDNRASWKAIICDLCQKAPATKEFLREDTTEYLCIGCYDLRDRGQRYKEFASWEESGNVKIALVEISLDTELLLKTLSNCFNKEFKEELAKQKKENVTPKDFGFSIIFEFLDDYQRFKAEVRDQVNLLRPYRDRTKGLEVINILENLFIVKIEDLKNLMLITEEYVKTYKKYFKKLLELKESPIFLAISCANIKYPFFEHWRSLEGYKEGNLGQTEKKRFSVLISIFGKGPIETEIWNMENVVRFYQEISSRKGSMRARHKLSEIAKFSKSFADKIMSDKKRDKDDYNSQRIYQQLMDPARPHGLDHRSLLTLAKIIGD